LTRWHLHAGDNRVLMSNMGDNTVDAVVTDGPYELVSITKRFGPGSAPQQYGSDGAYQRAARGFMGQTWDGTGIVNDPTFWAEVLRVLKPGGHLLSFGGTRTYHRMACAVEDAGFEIRDMLEWLYGSGFPKGSVVDGWGPSLKPGHEPICLARKPFRGSITTNREWWGTGALNIDGCRIDGEERALISPDRRIANNTYGEGLGGSRYAGTTTQGRFPANVVHDGSDEVVAAFPANAGAAAPASGETLRGGNCSVARGHFAGLPEGQDPAFHGDTGSAARFYYCAKASKRDRDEGCEHLPAQAAGMVSDHSGSHITRREEGYEPPQRANHHPTVKPTALMRWLVRLVTPPGGLVFDPFTGSGSTGKAALLEGFRFIGAEMTPEYIPIARARLTAASSLHIEGQ
jgi:site-specific DNA-methyltransferase (adenine-specific)